MKKILLFDADGVLTHSQQPFSVTYTTKYGLDLDDFSEFFKTEWNDYVTGRKDLRDHVSNNLDFWQWDGTPDEFLDLWFRTTDSLRGLLIVSLKLTRPSKRVTLCFLMIHNQKLTQRMLQV